jgi:prepilin-type N-terminal cleavage/methylation domain-containing protein
VLEFLLSVNTRYGIVTHRRSLNFINYLNTMNKVIKKSAAGFTLIEILIVIGLIAILSAIVLVAVNPAQQFKKANDAQRASNINAILNAVGQYTVDNKGALPGGITTTAQNLSDAGADICNDLVPEFLAALPADPGETDQSIDKDECEPADNYDTGYSISKDADNRVTITAPDTEIGADISVTR